MPQPASEQAMMATLRPSRRAALSLPLLLLVALPTALLVGLLPWYLVLLVLSHARTLLAAW